MFKIRGKDNWWASSSKEEQIEFEKKAVSQAKSFVRNFYRKRSHDREGVGFQAMRRSILLAGYKGQKEMLQLVKL